MVVVMMTSFVFVFEEKVVNRVLLHCVCVCFLRVNFVLHDVEWVPDDEELSRYSTPLDSTRYEQQPLSIFRKSAFASAHVKLFSNSQERVSF